MCLAGWVKEKTRDAKGIVSLREGRGKRVRSICVMGLFAIVVGEGLDNLKEGT